MLLGPLQLNLQAPRLYAVIAPDAGWVNPSALQVLQGLNGSGAAATWAGSAEAPTSSITFDWPSLATGLTAGTSYRVAVVWSSGAAQSNVAVSGAFTTTAGGSVSLVVQDAAHAQVADNLVLTASFVLTVDGATHAQQADNLGLSTEVSLVVDAAAHVHLADNITLSTVGSVTLAIDAAVHAQLAESPTLTTAQVLAVADAIHAQIADNLTLSANNDIALTIDASTHAQLADAPTLNTATWLAIANALQAQLADNVGLTGGVIVAQNGLTVFLRRRRR